MSSESLDPRFARLEDLFRSGLSQNETGAAFALRVAGTTVAHSWGGLSDRRSRAPWTAGSLCCAFSVTKALGALAVLRAVGAGELDLDEPVSRCWPAFAEQGKAEISLRQVLAHQSGVIGCRSPLVPADYYSSTAMANQLAREPAWWEPGTRHGYQARTFGLLLDEALTRATRLNIRERLLVAAGEAGAQTSFYLGLPKNALGRCVTLEPARATAEEMKQLPDETWEMLRAMADPQTPTGAAFQNPRLSRRFMNEVAFQQANLASSGVHGTAAGIAAVFDALWASLPAGLQREAMQSHSSGQDEVLLTRTSFGLGLMLDLADPSAGFGPGSFGHVGSGGAVLLHQPEQAATFVFLPNRLRAGVMSWGPTAETLMQESLALL
ncbi:MAG: serine hydrolase domain-containing protein [Pseudomonadota bacterium]